MTPNISRVETLVSLALQRLANQCGRESFLNNLRLNIMNCLHLRIFIFDKTRPVSSNSVLSDVANFQLILFFLVWIHYILFQLNH